MNISISDHFWDTNMMPIQLRSKHWLVEWATSKGHHLPSQRMQRVFDHLPSRYPDAPNTWMQQFSSFEVLWRLPHRKLMLKARGLNHGSSWSCQPQSHQAVEWHIEVPWNPCRGVELRYFMTWCLSCSAALREQTRWLKSRGWHANPLGFVASTLTKPGQQDQESAFQLGLSENRIP